MSDSGSSPSSGSSGGPMPASGLATLATSRRSVLKGLAGAAGLAVVPGALAAACSSSKSKSGSTPSAGGSSSSAGTPTSAPSSGGGGGGGNVSGTVTFGSNYSDAVPKAAFAAMIGGFTAKNSGVDVKINTVDHNTFQNNINNYLQGTPDDLFTWFAGFRMRFFASQGLATPIDDVWDKIGSNFSDAFKNASKGDDGHYYFVPLYNYPWAVFYRKSVFASKGYQIPKTWDDFVALQKQMQKDGLVPMAMGQKDGWPALGTFDIINMRLNGFQFHMDLMAHKVGWDDPKVLNVFKQWQEVLPYQQPGATGRIWQDAAKSLLNKQAGMYLLGSFVSQQFTGAVLFKDDLDRYPLHHLDIVAGGVFRRQQRESGPGPGHHALDAPRKGAVGESIDLQLHRLTGTHVGDLGLLEVGHHPGLFHRHHRQQRLSGTDVVADLHRLARHPTVGQGKNLRIGQIEPRLVELGGAQGNARLVAAIAVQASGGLRPAQCLGRLVAPAGGTARGGLQPVETFAGDRFAGKERPTALQIELRLGQLGFGRRQTGARPGHPGVIATGLVARQSQLRLRLAQRRLGFVGVELDQQIASLDQLVVGHMHLPHLAADARRDHVHGRLDKGIVGTHVHLVAIPDREATDDRQQQHRPEHEPRPPPSGRCGTFRCGSTPCPFSSIHSLTSQLSRSPAHPRQGQLFLKHRLPVV